MLVFKLNVGRLECCRFAFFFIPFRTATGSIQFNYLSCLNGSCQDNEQNGAGNKTEWETRGKLNRWQAIQVIAINSWCDKNPTNMKNARCGSVEYVQLDTGIVRIFPLTTVTKNGVKHHKMFQQIFCVAMISFHVYLWGGGDAADRQLTTCVTIFVFECRSNRMSDNYHNWNEKVTRMWTWQKVSSYGNGWTEMHQFQQIGYTKILLIHFEIYTIPSCSVAVVVVAFVSGCFVWLTWTLNNTNERQQIETDVNTSYRMHSNISPECARLFVAIRI